MGEIRTPAEVFDAYVERVNAGDIDAVMDLFDENVVATPAIRAMFGAQDGSDRAALRNYIDTTVIRTAGAIKTIRVATAGEWVYGVLELASEFVTSLGIERIRGIDEARVDDGKITSFSFIPDVFDAQTQVFFRAVSAGPS